MVGELQAHSVDDPSHPRIDVFFTPAAVTNERLRGYTAIVIDVLRAATSISYALNNGAREVIPAESSTRVIELASELSRDDTLLCGEKHGKKVEGFNLGNSPSEYKPKVVDDKTLVFGTTNGTPALIRASVAKSVYLCGFININAVIDAIILDNNPFPLAIVCSGKYDSFALEDVVCAGLIVKRLKQKLPNIPRLNDAGRAAEFLYGEFGNSISDLLRSCDHGKYLTEIGMETDLELCAQDSVLDLAPLLTDGKLVAAAKTN